MTTLYDISGACGALLIVLTYLLLQLDRIDPKSLSYSALNAIGALLILISLWHDFNLGAALVEGFWLLVSGIGLIRYARRGSSSGQSAPG